MQIVILLTDDTSERIIKLTHSLMGNKVIAFQALIAGSLSHKFVKTYYLPGLLNREKVWQKRADFITKKLEEENIENPIIIVTSPQDYEIVMRLKVPNSKLVFDSAYENIEEKTLTLDTELCKIADLVFVPFAEKQTHSSAFCQNVKTLPSGLPDKIFDIPPEKLVADLEASNTIACVPDSNVIVLMVPVMQALMTAFLTERPVVCPVKPEFMQYADSVYFCASSDKKEIETAISRAMQEKDSSLIRRRRAWAMAANWKSRAWEFLQAIRELED